MVDLDGDRARVIIDAAMVRHDRSRDEAVGNHADVIQLVDVRMRVARQFTSMT